MIFLQMKVMHFGLVCCVATFFANIHLKVAKKKNIYIKFVILLDYFGDCLPLCGVLCMHIDVGHHELSNNVIPNYNAG